MTMFTVINPDLEKINQSLIHPKVENKSLNTKANSDASIKDLHFDITKIDLGQSFKDLAKRLMH